MQLQGDMIFTKSLITNRNKFGEVNVGPVSEVLY